MKHLGVCAVLALVLVCGPSFSSGEIITVGGADGWGPYVATRWTPPLVHMRTRLRFVSYQNPLLAPETPDVWLMYDAAHWVTCNFTNATWVANGTDVITEPWILAYPNSFYFADHANGGCKKGMKVNITVIDGPQAPDAYAPGPSYRVTAVPTPAPAPVLTKLVCAPAPAPVASAPAPTVAVIRGPPPPWRKPPPPSPPTEPNVVCHTVLLYGPPQFPSPPPPQKTKAKAPSKAHAANTTAGETPPAIDPSVYQKAAPLRISTPSSLPVIIGAVVSTAVMLALI